VTIQAFEMDGIGESQGELIINKFKTRRKLHKRILKLCLEGGLGVLFGGADQFRTPFAS